MKMSRASFTHFFDFFRGLVYLKITTTLCLA